MTPWEPRMEQSQGRNQKDKQITRNIPTDKISELNELI